MYHLAIHNIVHADLLFTCIIERVSSHPVRIQIHELIVEILKHVSWTPYHQHAVTYTPKIIRSLTLSFLHDPLDHPYHLFPRYRGRASR